MGTAISFVGKNPSPGEVKPLTQGLIARKKQRQNLAVGLILDYMLPYPTGEWDAPQWFQGLHSSLLLRGCRVEFPDTPIQEEKTF